MPLNKVNLCWVLSDGRKGHEIQSMTLACGLSTDVKLFSFALKQPWLSFTPRRIPKFELSLNWLNEMPTLDPVPNIIITTGRRAAAVGKHFRDQINKINLNCKLIQILNPKDNLAKYDLVLIPNHDEVSAANVVNYHGSINAYSEEWFNQDKDPSMSEYLAIFLGNPDKKYFMTRFSDEINFIRNHSHGTPLYLCGSPRLNLQTKKIIHAVSKPKDKIWLTAADGNNPYQALLKNAKKIFVTSDSINMINEACQSQAPISILANDFIPTPKHLRFIESINNRVTELDSHEKPITIIDNNQHDIISNPLMQSLINSSD